MSYMNRPHSKELTQSLKDHGLDTKRPSQLSDAFRLGWWASEKELSKQRDELLEALKCAEPLAKLASLVTVKQAIYAGDWAINACGLDPYCLNEGSALGDELAVAWWKIKEVSEAISSAEK